MDVVFAAPLPPASRLRAAIRACTRLDETQAVAQILAAAEMPPQMRDRIAERARDLVTAVRRERQGRGGIDALLHEYALSSQEGVVLLCLAEALLRIPDADTIDQLIRDKLGEADWARHLGHSESVFVNASTWALMLTGRFLHAEPGAHDLRAAWRRFIARSGEPVVRQAVVAAMRILARQFVIGRTIAEALDRARPAERQGWRHSYD
ncbi:MAG: bifunctional proline dehydrogenase/L-glutamate gamma-semialdehyde dehydrogenase, partial [Stellaceae bacterium]